MTITLKPGLVLACAVLAIVAVGVAVGLLLGSSRHQQTVVVTVTAPDPSVEARLVEQQDEAAERAAALAVRSTIPAAEAFYASIGNSSYAGLTDKTLRQIDPKAKAHVGWVRDNGQSYCLEDDASTSQGYIAFRSIRGEAIQDDGNIVNGSC